jgi:hypothetical protein
MPSDRTRQTWNDIKDARNDFDRQVYKDSSNPAPIRRDAADRLIDRGEPLSTDSIEPQSEESLIGNLVDGVKSLFSL